MAGHAGLTSGNLIKRLICFRWQRNWTRVIIVTHSGIFPRFGVFAAQSSLNNKQSKFSDNFPRKLSLKYLYQFQTIQTQTAPPKF